MFSEGKEGSGGSNGLVLELFFVREEAFTQHKYAVDLNSIFRNLPLPGCYCRQFLIGGRKLFTSDSHGNAKEADSL